MMLTGSHKWELPPIAPSKVEGSSEGHPTNYSVTYYRSPESVIRVTGYRIIIIINITVTCRRVRVTNKTGSSSDAWIY
jgi:hypothetical protein